MQVIGFTNKFYTLWEVSEVYQVRVSKYEYYEKQDFRYIKNLSMDLETAKSKVEGEFDIDLTLRGESEFTRTSEKMCDAPDNVFKFGKYREQDIFKTNDVNYTSWYYNQTNCQVSREFLLENGFVDYNGDLISENAYEEIKEILKREEYVNSLKKGHHFENGKRVSLELMEIDELSFDGYYVMTYVITYASKCGKIFKYMGSNPPKISTEDYQSVKATIKHDNYKGENETKLQRIK